MQYFSSIRTFYVFESILKTEKLLPLNSSVTSIVPPWIWNTPCKTEEPILNQSPGWLIPRDCVHVVAFLLLLSDFDKSTSLPWHDNDIQDSVCKL